MQIIKKLNNNVAIGRDQNGKEVVVFGKGIGFGQMPYELTDLSRIERTFYDMHPRYLELVRNIDERVLLLTARMVDVIQAKVGGTWNSNLVFVLADHIDFALKREKNGLAVNFPYSDELELEQPLLNKWAFWIVRNIDQNFQVKLPKGEITCIAMHLINSHGGQKKCGNESLMQKSERIHRAILKIIEDHFQTHLNRKDLNYYRFRDHIRYFVRRKEKNEEFTENTGDIFEAMRTAYPQTYECVLKIDEYLMKEYGSRCQPDELLYLMIHINRLVQRGL